jgi:membrane protease YdiL (CAAX protease family)
VRPVGALAVDRVNEPRRQPAVQRRLVGWWALVGTLSVLAFAANAASNSEPTTDALYQYETAIVGGLFYLLVLGITLVIASGFNSREAFALRRPTSWLTALGLSLGLLVLLLAVAAALEPVFGAGEEQGLDPTGWDPDRAPAFALNFVLTAMMAPVVEELLFRGIGFFLLEQFGQVAAILVTGIAFALTHGITEGIPIFFIIGVGLAFMRSRTKSIYPPVLMHAGFNGIGVVGGLFN